MDTKTKLELKELIDWHMHNAIECRRPGDEDQREFHLYAVALLSKVYHMPTPNLI